MVFKNNHLQSDPTNHLIESFINQHPMVQASQHHLKGHVVIGSTLNEATLHGDGVYITTLLKSVP